MPRRVKREKGLRGLQKLQNGSFNRPRYDGGRRKYLNAPLAMDDFLEKREIAKTKALEDKPGLMIGLLQALKKCYQHCCPVVRSRRQEVAGFADCRRGLWGSLSRIGKSRLRSSFHRQMAGGLVFIRKPNLPTARREKERNRSFHTFKGKGDFEVEKRRKGLKACGA